MHWSDIIKQAFIDLKANKLRSTLTLFGIIWGIMAIMILLGWGFGFRDYMWEGMGKIGKEQRPGCFHPRPHIHRSGRIQNRTARCPGI